MNKRNFLKASAAIVSANMLSRLAPSEAEARTNWAGNYRYNATHLDQPESVEDVQKIVRSCRELKALGARHSFNGIADSTGNQLSLKKMTGMSLDANARTVTVESGVTYGRIAP